MFPISKLALQREPRQWHAACRTERTYLRRSRVRITNSNTITRHPIPKSYTSPLNLSVFLFWFICLVECGFVFVLRSIWISLKRLLTWKASDRTRYCDDVSVHLRLDLTKLKMSPNVPWGSRKMILKIKSPPGAKPPVQERPKEERNGKKTFTQCEDRCPGDPWAYCIVLWCACAMSLISSGYSLYKQQGLQDRLSLLEEQHFALRSAVLEPQQPLVERLRREVLARPPPSYWRPRRSIRDYGDCVCPPGQLLSCLFVENFVMPIKPSSSKFKETTTMWNLKTEALATCKQRWLVSDGNKANSLKLNIVARCMCFCWVYM